MPAIATVRGAIGVAFIALAGVTLWRVLAVPKPPGTKLLGAGFAIVLLALGGARIIGYVRYRNRTR